jgi:hypothetical protein
VTERFNEWLMDKAKVAVKFSAEQLAWLNLIRDHIATALSIEPEDLELSPFNQRGGLGKAHQLFGERLPTILDELNLKTRSLTGQHALHLHQQRAEGTRRRTAGAERLRPRRSVAAPLLRGVSV